MSADDAFIRTLLLFVAIVLLVPFLVMLVLMPLMGFWGGGHMWNGWSGGGTIWTWVLPWAVFLVVILGGGYLLARSLDRGERQKTDPALEELRVAYARGELSDEEFEERRERLRRER
ncbi:MULTISPECIES: SHOCT domain-containing protein [Natrialbaceae]|uniref:SHOCT domain-containing protein n=1 Tax=Natrialbaceae TaxID=1644061 RepID=UPI00207D1B81|nr:SHOCT domain-containing protein [Natronococcus sp. CG52]